MMNVGQKIEMHNILKTCATALGHDHPIIVPLRDDELEKVAGDIADGVIEGVLKRSHSGWSNHIITKHAENPRQSIRDALKVQAKYWGQPNHQFVQPRWLLQPYIPHLIRLGELRTFVVDGIFYYAVYTTPEEGSLKDMQMTVGSFVRPLGEFRYATLLLFKFPVMTLP